MSISDYTIGKHRGHRKKCKEIKLEDILHRIHNDVVMGGVGGVVHGHENVQKLREITGYFLGNISLLKACSYHHCLHDFWSKYKHIRSISTRFDFYSITFRHKHRCDSVTATRIMLQMHGSTNKWKGTKLQFGLCFFHILEVFNNIIENFTEITGKLPNLRGSFLPSSAKMYADGISFPCEPVWNCMGFIDCARIKTCRPGGN